MRYRAAHITFCKLHWCKYFYEQCEVSVLSAKYAIYAIRHLVVFLLLIWHVVYY